MKLLKACLFLSLISCSYHWRSYESSKELDDYKTYCETNTYPLSEFDFIYFSQTGFFGGPETVSALSPKGFEALSYPGMSIDQIRNSSVCFLGKKNETSHLFILVIHINGERKIHQAKKYLMEENYLNIYFHTNKNFRIKTKDLSGNSLSDLQALIQFELELEENTVYSYQGQFSALLGLNIKKDE